jgi:NADH:ubiquinone oxidoreductase subunit C
MDAETILRTLDESGAYEHKSDGYWAAWPGLDVRAMAELMRTQGARLVTLTALPDSDGGLRVIYAWDVASALVNISTTVTSGSIPTISDILPAADWVEREIRDYYALEFEGRAETPTLMLREGDEPGLFSRTCDLGTDTDPAEIARAAWDAAEAGEL